MIKLRVIDHLSKEQIRMFNQIRRSAREKEQEESKTTVKPVAKKKKEASLSKRELEELMGTRRDTYKRVNGAVRRK